MKTYIEKLFAEKDLAPGSVRKYKTNLTRLNKGDVVTNLEFLKDYDEIISILNELSLNTKRDSLISIVSALSSLKRQNKQIREVYGRYNKLLKEYNSEFIKSNDMSDGVKKSWLTKQEIDTAFNQLYLKVKKFRYKSDISTDQYKILFQLVVLGLYKLLPPRRGSSYIKMIIATDNDAGNKINVFNTVSKKFIFKDYKTKKTYGIQEVSIPKNLMTILKIYLKFHLMKNSMKLDKQVPFLVNWNGFHGQPQLILNTLSKTFGKSIGSASFRRTFATHKFGDMMKEMESDSRKMGTSTEILQNHYIKRN
jgi:hypothetical protein